MSDQLNVGQVLVTLLDLVAGKLLHYSVNPSRFRGFMIFIVSGVSSLSIWILSNGYHDLRGSRDRAT